MILKLVGLGTLAGVIANVVGDTATLVGAIAAGVAGSIYLASKAIVLMRECTELIRHWKSTVQLIQVVPPFMESINREVTDVKDRLSAIESKADQIHEPVQAVARELDVHQRRSDAA